MSEIETEQREQQQGPSLELERIIFFSDAVIAIAITLLAVQVGLPANVALADVPDAIMKLVPQFGIYAMSFLIIGNYWVIHHRVFQHIRHYDTTLIWLNVLFLLFIAFLPVPSHIFGRFPTQQSAIIFFDVCLFFVGLSQTALWWYASSNHRLLTKSFSPALIRWGMVRSLVPPAVMLLSILLTYVSTTAAVISWILIWIGYVMLNRYYPR